MRRPTAATGRRCPSPHTSLHSQALAGQETGEPQPLPLGLPVYGDTAGIGGDSRGRPDCSSEDVQSSSTPTLRAGQRACVGLHAESTLLSAALCRPASLPGGRSRPILQMRRLRLVSPRPQQLQAGPSGRVLPAEHSLQTCGCCVSSVWSQDQGALPPGIAVRKPPGGKPGCPGGVIHTCYGISAPSRRHSDSCDPQQPLTPSRQRPPRAHCLTWWTAAIRVAPQDTSLRPWGDPRTPRSRPPRPRTCIQGSHPSVETGKRSVLRAEAQRPAVGPAKALLRLCLPGRPLSLSPAQPQGLCVQRCCLAPGSSSAHPRGPSQHRGAAA